jgi:hypothetical protein
MGPLTYKSFNIHYYIYMRFNSHLKYQHQLIIYYMLKRFWKRFSTYICCLTMQNFLRKNNAKLSTMYNTLILIRVNNNISNHFKFYINFYIYRMVYMVEFYEI